MGLSGREERRALEERDRSGPGGCNDPQHIPRLEPRIGLAERELPGVRPERRLWETAEEVGGCRRVAADPTRHRRGEKGVAPRRRGQSGRRARENIGVAPGPASHEPSREIACHLGLRDLV